MKSLKRGFVAGMRKKPEVNKQVPLIASIQLENEPMIVMTRWAMEGGENRTPPISTKTGPEREIARTMPGSDNMPHIH